MTAYASSTARTVFVGTPNQSVVAPRSLSKSSDDNGPSARMRSSTRPATSAFSARMRDAFLLEVTRNHGSSLGGDERESFVVRLEDLAALVQQVAPGGVVLGHARMQHEVMAPTGNRERIELDRAPAPEDTEHGVWSSLERTRRRERVARHEEATCGLGGDPHAEDAIGWQPRLTRTHCRADVRVGDARD